LTEEHRRITCLVLDCMREHKLYLWCKGTSVHSLTSPVSHYVYMYSPQFLYISDYSYTTPTSSR
jgi:hypothetical protein